MPPTVINEMLPTEVMEALVFRYAYDNFRERTTWEQTRSLAYFSVAPHLSKGRSITPKKLMPMPYDEEQKQGETKSIEELRKMYAGAAALKNNNG